jgi:hypothetical protein
VRQRAIGPPIHPQPTRSEADLPASFVAAASTEHSMATIIAGSLPVIHQLGGPDKQSAATAFLQS